MKDKTQTTGSITVRHPGGTTTFAVTFDGDGKPLDIRIAAVLMRGFDRFLGCPWSHGNKGSVIWMVGAKGSIIDLALDCRAHEIGCLHIWRDCRSGAVVEYAPANDDGDIRYIVRIKRGDGSLDRFAVDSGRYASLRLGSPELATALLAAADAAKAVTP